MMHRQIFLIVLLISLSSCDGFLKQEVHVKGMPEHPLPIIEGYLNTGDSLIRVRVSHAEPAVGGVTEGEQRFRPMPDAQVWIGNEKMEVALSFDEALGYFKCQTAKLSLNEGEYYHLRLITPWGSLATASCLLPTGTIDPASLLLERYAPDEFGMETGSVGWRDIAGHENNYYLHEYEYDDSGQRARLIDDIGFMPVSDTMQDGNMLFSEPFLLKNNSPTNRYFYTLYQVDAHFYQFHKSLQEVNQLNDNIFAEPFNLYSNISGGLGVFGAMKKQISFQIEE